MIEEALFTQLTEDEKVGGKIAITNGFNLFPLRIPDKADLSGGYAITYTQVKEGRVYPALKLPVFQFNCFGDTFEKARDLAQDVENCLDDLSEIKLGNDTNVNYVKLTNKVPLFDNTAKLFYFVIEISLKY